MKKPVNYVITFSKYLVLSFLRIENLYVLVNKSRDYGKYLKILEMLEKYMTATGDNDRISTLQESIEELLIIYYENDKGITEKINMYDYVLEKIPENSTINDNSIDCLNDIVHKNYEIDNKNFFSSIVNNKEECYEDLDEKLTDSIALFIKEYRDLFRRAKHSHIKKSTIMDIKVVIIISATELISALHHIYVAYYIYKKNNDLVDKRKENINKAYNHLQRAILDIKEVRLISDQKHIKHEDIKKRLDKINDVGTN